jgi:DNA-binding transcriptional MerR regulator
MAVLTIRDVSRRSGLSEPTLRYYEEIGLIGPIARDESSGHRRYQTEDLDVLQALACMRATGVGIEDMRTYQANRGRGHEAAAEQRDLLQALIVGADCEDDAKGLARELSGDGRADADTAFRVGRVSYRYMRVPGGLIG